MSNYVKSTNFTAKDSLTSGDPDKKVKGSEFDVEFDAIATAVGTKEDTANKGANNGYCGLGSDSKVSTTNLPASTEAAIGAIERATTAEAAAGTDTERAVTPAGLEAWAAQNGGMVQDISNLADPNADQLLGWDDSAGAVVGFTAGTGMTFSGTTFACTITQVTNASELTSGTLPDARIQASGVTQHQASLSITEAQVQDGSTLARMGGNEAVTGAWTFSQVIKKASGGAYVHYDSATYAGGKITVSTSDASGSPTTAGDLWIKYTA